MMVIICIMYCFHVKPNVITDDILLNVSHYLIGGVIFHHIRLVIRVNYVFMPYLQFTYSN